jgi:hypothetical protein
MRWGGGELIWLILSHIWANKHSKSVQVFSEKNLKFFHFLFPEKWIINNNLRVWVQEPRPQVPLLRSPRNRFFSSGVWSGKTRSLRRGSKSFSSSSTPKKTGFNNVLNTLTFEKSWLCSTLDTRYCSKKHQYMATTAK